MNKALILLSFFIFVVNLTYAQSDYYNTKNMQYIDRVYYNNFATVQLYKQGFELSMPYIQLNTNEQLRLSFDDLNAGTKSYAFTFVLCNSNWEPADLLQMEYLEGMPEDYVSANFQSFNTLTHYTHYEFAFPNNSIKITKSGNYLLKVYPEGYPEDIILTKRFYVFENKVGIKADVIYSSNSEERKTTQEINLVMNLNSYNMPNPYENLTIKIIQNQRTDNTITLNKPKGIVGNSMYFNTPGDLTFEAGNEFRNCDIRSLLTQSSRISTIKQDSNGYHVLMLGDNISPRKNYLKYQDINGNFLIHSYDNIHLSNKIEADYAWVTFTLAEAEELDNGSVFLLGGLTQWSLHPDYKMTYNQRLKAYQITLFLKQGFYDYQYVFIPNNTQKGTVSRYENSFSETENEYTIMVYYREQGDIYEKLIAIQSIQSTF